MGVENLLWLAGVIAESAVVLLLVRRQIWNRLPIFTVYCAWDLTVNIAAFLLFSRSNIHHYFLFYRAFTVLDSLLVFSVLVETLWSVLSPLRSHLSHQVPFYIFAGLLLLAIALWPVTSGVGSAVGPFRSLVHIVQDVALLRILIFLTLAGLSHLLTIGWRDRELQVITGLGIYSVASFGAGLLRTHNNLGSQDRTINEFVVASYVCSLLYWAYGFAQKEAERHEFTPQMQNVLLAMAGVAREQRLALAQAAMERQQGKA